MQQQTMQVERHRRRGKRDMGWPYRIFTKVDSDGGWIIQEGKSIRKSHLAFANAISHAGPAVVLPESSSGYKALERHCDRCEPS